MRQRKGWSRIYWFRLVCLILVLGLSSSAAWAADDDDFIDLPGDSEDDKPKQKAKAQSKAKVGPQLPLLYGPPKEWQSFRSTARVTCLTRIGQSIWAGTQGGGLIRWNTRTGGYRFYVPKTKDSRARTILALAAGPSGNLWIGTAGYGLALLRKGRSRWVFYRSRKQLPDLTVQSLAWVEGRLWIGTRKGVARMQNGKWRKWTTRRGLPASDIRAIKADSRGRIWFSPNISTPFYWTGRRFKRIRRFPVVGASCIVSDRSGGIWLCSEQGAVHYNGRRARLYTMDHGLAGSHVQTIYVDAGRGVWLGTKNRGISYFKGSQWITMNRAHGLPGLDIRSIIGLPGGELVAASFLGGIARYTQGRWNRMAVGIVGNKIQAVSYAPDGSVWVGTSSGMSRFYRGYWYNLTSILPNPDVRAFAFDPAGRTWIGTYGGGVVRYDGQKWKVFDVMDGLGSNRIVGAGLTPEGLWFAHELKGVSLYNGKSWKVYNDRNTRGLLSFSYPVSSIFVDRNFRVWLGTKGGGLFVRRYLGSWRRVGLFRSGTSRGVVFSVTQDDAGQIWVGTKAGLYRYVGRKGKRFTRSNGLPHNKVLAVGAEGNKIWIGTPKGVACFDGTSWRSFSRDSGLISNHIATIGVTPWGAKWFGSAGDGLTIYRGE